LRHFAAFPPGQFWHDLPLAAKETVTDLARVQFNIPP
jgi:hypothetical protein